MDVTNFGTSGISHSASHTNIFRLAHQVATFGVDQRDPGLDTPGKVVVVFGARVGSDGSLGGSGRLHFQVVAVNADHRFFHRALVRGVAADRQVAPYNIDRAAHT